jgi:hypothetical protein
VRTAFGRVFGLFVALSAGSAVAYLVLLRPWHTRWGATREEAARAMPGDELVPDPTVTTTRAVTIHAPAEAVWPWLVQMGELPRAGFYSYEWIQRALGLQVENADRIRPELQHLSEGDAIDRSGSMVVFALQPGHALVLGPFGEQPWGTSTWSMALYPLDGGSVRLVSRMRLRLTLPSLPALVVLDPGVFIMERRWLLGVKERAERAAGWPEPSMAPGDRALSGEPVGGGR